MITSHTTLAQGVSARHTNHVSCACVFDLSSTLSSHSSFVSPIFYFILLIFHFIFYVDRFGAKFLCALPRMRSLAFWSTTHLSHKQAIARSSAEADLYAAALGASESEGVVWLRRSENLWWLTPNPLNTLSTDEGICRLKNIDVTHGCKTKSAQTGGASCEERTKHGSGHRSTQSGSNPEACGNPRIHQHVERSLRKQERMNCRAVSRHADEETAIQGQQQQQRRSDRVPMKLRTQDNQWRATEASWPIKTRTETTSGRTSWDEEPEDERDKITLAWRRWRSYPREGLALQQRLAVWIAQDGILPRDGIAQDVENQEGGLEKFGQRRWNGERIIWRRLFGLGAGPRTLTTARSVAITIWSLQKPNKRGIRKGQQYKLCTGGAIACSVSVVWIKLVQLSHLVTRSVTHSNAHALAQVVPKNRVPFLTVGPSARTTE